MILPRWRSGRIAFAATAAMSTSVVMCSAIASSPPWLEPACDARVRLTVSGDLYSRASCNVQTILALGRLASSGLAAVPESLVLRDPATGQVVPVELLRVDAPDKVALRWKAENIRAFERRPWDLYFRMNSRPDWSAALALVGAVDDTESWSTGLEEPDAVDPARPRAFRNGGADVQGETSALGWSDACRHGGQRGLGITRSVSEGAKLKANSPFWWSWPPPIEVSPGVIYSLEAWASVPAGSAVTAVVTLRFFDGDNRRIQGAAREPSVRTGETGWTKLRSTSMAPPRSRRAAVMLSMSGDNGTVCFDDIMVGAVPGSTLPQLTANAGTVEVRAR